MPDQNIEPNSSENRYQLKTHGCGSQPEATEDNVRCPECGSDQMEFDFFANLVCKKCGHIEYSSYT